MHGRGRLVTSTVYRQQYSTLPVWLADHGIGTGAYGWLIAVNGGVILCLEIPATVALRRRPPLPIIGTGPVLVGAGYAALAGGPYIATAVTMMVLLTAGEILYKPTATAHVADSAPEHLQGRFQSLYAGASVSGTVLAPPLAAPCTGPPRRAVAGLRGAGRAQRGGAADGRRAVAARCGGRGRGGRVRDGRAGWGGRDAAAFRMAGRLGKRGTQRLAFDT